MGLFAINTGDYASSKAWAETAIANLQLFIETSNHSNTLPTFSSAEYPSDYLLALATDSIQCAFEAYKKECDANPMINPVDLK